MFTVLAFSLGLKVDDGLLLFRASFFFQVTSREELAQQGYHLDDS